MAGEELILTSVLSLVFNNVSFDSIDMPVPNKQIQIEEMSRDLKGLNLVVATSQNYPLSYAVKRNGKLEGAGVSFVFLKILQSKYGFNYSVVLPDEDVMGTETTGLFGILKSGKADVAAAFLPVVREGQDIIQYSRDLDTGEWVVMMRRPRESAQGSGLLAPFTLVVWVLILVSLIAVGPTIYLLLLLRYWLCPLDDKSSKLPLPSCIWFVYGALLKQGSTLSPMSDSARLIFATWWIFITILTAFYTANLTAFLTLSQFTLPIDKPDDIMKYKWVTRKGNAVEHAALDEAETHTRTKEGEFVSDNNTEILENFVRTKEYLFLQERPIVDHLIYEDYLDKYRKGIPESERCIYVKTTWPVISRNLAFGYTKNFKYKEVFDYTLQYLVEAGIIRFRLSDGLPNTPICPLNLKSTERQLQNSDLWTTYQVVFVGFGIAALVFVVEVFTRYRKNCCGGKVKTPIIKTDTMNNNDYYAEKGEPHDFIPPPPSYQTLFGQMKNAEKKNVNGRDYWVMKQPDGDTRLVPVRQSSALLYQYTN